MHINTLVPLKSYEIEFLFWMFLLHQDGVGVFLQRDWQHRNITSLLDNRVRLCFK